MSLKELIYTMQLEQTTCIYSLSLKINIFHVYREHVWNNTIEVGFLINLKTENYISQISAIDHFLISFKVYISYIVILTFFSPI